MNKKLPVEEVEFKFQRVIPSKEYYDRFVELIAKFPELVYKAKGYEGLSREVQEARKDEIAEITGILKKSFLGFVSFQNFHPRMSGDIEIRMQHKWDERFTGVGYYDIRHWDPEIHGTL